jgi:class 3 adenylate cyclase
MKRFVRKVTIGAKIFGLAVCMLLLLIALSIFIYDRTNKITDEFEGISDFLVPLEDHLTRMNNLANEQAVHLEKVWRLYEAEPLDIVEVNKELEIFEKLDVLIKEQITIASQRTDEVIAVLNNKEDIIELAQMKAILKEIEKEQQDYHSQTFKIIRFIKKDARKRVHFLQEEMEKAEVNVKDASQLLDNAINDVESQHSSVDFAPLATHLDTVKKEHKVVHSHAQKIIKLLPTDPKAYKKKKFSLKMFSKKYIPDTEEEQKKLKSEENEVQVAIMSSKEKINQIKSQHDSLNFNPLKSALDSVKENHLDVYSKSQNILQILYEDSKVESELLQEELQKEVDELNGKMEVMMSQIATHTEMAANFIEVQVRKTLLFSKSMVVFATFIGLLLATIVTIGLIRPVKNLLRGTKEIEKGNLEIEVVAKSSDEIGELSVIFNSMVKDIREKERIKATFGQYVDPRIVDDMIKKGGLVQNSGEREVVTVFLSDVVAFSTISERLTPDGLVNMINNYLSLASEPIIRYRGVIDKFIGDAVVAFWGPPFVGEQEHARLACNAAMEQFVQLDKLRKRMPDLMGIRKGLPEVNIRIGLATGEVLVGNIGSENSKSYTIIGEVTKIVSSLEELNKKYGTQILIMDTTRDLVASDFETRKIDLIHANGSQRLMYIYELLSHKGELDTEIVQMRDTFEDGLRLYWKQSWSKAKQHFDNCLKIKPNDGPTQLYLTRLEMFKKNPPGNNWDGVWK